MHTIRNPHVVSRLAHIAITVPVADHEPDHLLDSSPALTPGELAADALLSLENLHRYRKQSAATVTGLPAAVPPRAPLQPLIASSSGEQGSPCLPALGGLALSSDHQE